MGLTTTSKIEITSVPPSQNPRDSMKSTWRTDKSNWGFFHHLYEVFRIQPSIVNEVPPVHQKTEKLPAIPNWHLQVWVFVYASAPLAIQQLYNYVFGRNFNPVAAFFFYMVAYHAIAIQELNIIKRLGMRYGFLDGDKHARDEVPDSRVTQVVVSLSMTATIRPLLTVFLAYRTDKAPLSIDFLSLAIELCLYGVVLDFWFYWYHRVMHATDRFWRYHRTHHLTKHPNPLLTLYADHEQEIIDMVGIPLLTYISLKVMGLPMGFYEWWYCHQFVVFAELLGHSGLRIHGSAPNPINWLLRLSDTELVIEDHDLHHRTGWKKSHNYGKQTRVWDRIFGTCTARIESDDANIDLDNPARWPWF